MDEIYRREEQLFMAALERPVGERVAFLKVSCAADDELRRRVEALLKECEVTANLLDVPPERALAEAIRATISTDFLLEGPGQQIGRYKLLEKIGEGGSGVVYLAEQQSPVRRLVAFKIIKLGMDTREVIARFEAERQALALMEHSNIARALDAGATETGRPFFVMELVRGEKITGYADRHRLNTGARLRLFLQVCHAVQHAHQKGVIHRDLKPSNILVTSRDGAPLPMIIDFGIAKATHGRLTEHTLYTAFAQFIGTPAYMSPEQAGLNTLDVDTRMDIYSLGVLLYELLTGRTPLEADELSRLGIDEIRRRIREDDLPRPSTRLCALDQITLTDVAAQRQIEPSKLVHLLRGDLDWIVMHCLEKDRTRRYETANALARDIERHLNNEPVVARPPSAIYLLVKFIRRHRIGFAAGSAVATALIAGVAVATTLFFREKASRQRAVAAEQIQIQLSRQAEAGEEKARNEATHSKVVAGILQDMLQGVAPAIALGRDTQLLRQMLDDTAPRLRELQAQPLVQAELQITLGRAYFEVGEPVRGGELFSDALATRRKLLGESNVGTAEVLRWLGATLEHRGLFSEAEQCQREALAILKKQPGDWSPELAVTLDGLANALIKENRNHEAETIFQQELSLARHMSGDSQVPLVRALFGLAQVRSNEKNYSAAAGLYREIMAQYPEGAALPDLLILKNRILYKLGVALWMSARRTPSVAQDAEKILRESLAEERRLFGGPSADSAATLNILANVLADRARVPEAIAINREAVDMRRKLRSREPGNGEAAVSLAYSLKNLGEMLSRQDQFVEADALLDESLVVMEKSLTRPRSLRLEALVIRGGILLRLDRVPDAQHCFEEAGTLEAAHPDWNIVRLATGLHRCLSRQGRTAEIELVWAQWQAQCRNLSDGQDRGEFATSLLAAMAQVGRYAEAEAFAREILDQEEKARPDSWLVFALRTLVGNSLVAQKRFAEAEPLLLSGCSGLRAHIDDIPVQSSGRLLFPFQNLVELYHDWGQPERAVEWKQRQEEFAPRD